MKGNNSMIRQLPVFKGYTVDARLKQFRRVEYGKRLQFIEFDSPQGEKLLVKYIRTLDFNTQEGREIFKAVVG
jgi:hypothetical protein